MAWEKVNLRAGRGGARIPDEPYARIGNGQISINNAYLDRLGLAPGAACEVYADRSPRRIGLKVAAAGTADTAVLRKQSGSNTSILTSTRTLQAAGLHKYTSGTYPIVREGDLAVICIDPPEGIDGGR
jgi:hypothetical protein